MSLMISHGGTPSENLVGDLQTFSNLEAGFLYGFYETFYQYQKDALWLKVGQVDINTDFMVSDNGLLFAHSSFGIDPAMTINLPAPTYPVTGASITAQIPISKDVRIRLGLFDGQFSAPRNNYLSIDWSLNKREGFLNIVEGEFPLLDGRIKQKVGFYHHTGTFYDFEKQESRKGLSAVYSITDWLIEGDQQSGTNVFLQFDKSNKASSSVLYYVGLGLRFKNKIEFLKNDEIGIASGFAKVNPIDDAIAENYDLRAENILEASIKFSILDNIALQPYTQLISIDSIDPNAKNPFIFALRLHVNLATD